MTKRLRSILSVVLAMAMIFAMATTAFAANSDPNLSVYGNTEFTATVDASSAAQSVTLQVVPADAYYSPSYFTTQAAAEAVTFTPVAGGSFIPTVAATQNDTVVWKYGIYGEVTFANSLS